MRAALRFNVPLSPDGLDVVRRLDVAQRHRSDQPGRYDVWGMWYDVADGLAPGHWLQAPIRAWGKRYVSSGIPYGWTPGPWDKPGAGRWIPGFRYLVGNHTGLASWSVTCAMEDKNDVRPFLIEMLPLLMPEGVRRGAACCWLDNDISEMVLIDVTGRGQPPQPGPPPINWDLGPFD